MSTSKISAKIVADSISSQDIRLTTLQLTFHRFILPEFNTHRMFSRNASSSRAIPLKLTIEQVQKDPMMPVHWGKSQKGMQADHEIDNPDLAEDHWRRAAGMAARYAESLHCQGLHKQVANRILEPYLPTSVLVTATEWENFFELRDHDDAQPEIRQLAQRMKETMAHSEPTPLQPGEWHLPYIGLPDYKTVTGMAHQDGIEYLATLRHISAARCARVSYNNHDGSDPDIEKDLALADKLAKSGHWSPFEHQGTPMSPNASLITPGVTHLHKDGRYASGNFRGWLQHRQLLA